MKEIKLSPEIISEDEPSNKQENEFLIDKHKNINYLFDSRGSTESFLDNKSQINKVNKCNFKCYFVFCFFILIFVSLVSMIIEYIIFLYDRKPNFKIKKKEWIIPELNNRKYENYIFDNGLEVMLIQDPYFDMDGGALVIENGYLDDPLDEGSASLSSSLFTHLAFGDTKNISTLQNYFGTYLYEADEHFTNFRFNILNDGFKKFLDNFSKILDIGDNIEIKDNLMDGIINDVDQNYLSSINIINQEIHLLRYLVYGLKNESGFDILPQGNRQSLSKYTNEQLKEKLKNYIKKFINPKKIKIVIFSKYKFLVSSKYMKKYFEYLTTMESPKDTIDNKKENEYEIKEFNKSQIIFIKSSFNDPNAIRIIFYIDKKGNESYSELFYNSKYFYYIVDFFDETKEGSLNFLLTHSTEYNIKSIYADFTIVLKSVIKFTINIELNSLNNLNDIIFIVYQYMNKIIKEGIGKMIQIERYKEIKDICYQTIKYSEKTYDTIDLAKNNGENIINSSWVERDYFYRDCLPWNDTENITDIANNESYYYFSQLRPENSVVVLSIRDKDIHKITCNNESKFFLNCSSLKFDNFSQTIYYDINYKSYLFNSSQFERYLDDNNTANISFSPNYYKSNNSKSIDALNKSEAKNFSNNEFNEFYFIRNDSFKIPKIFISLNLLHPFLRPMNENANDTRCYYFQIIEMFSAIKRRINEKLADAIRAGNGITFGQNENYLFINIFCYNDVAYKIMQTISETIFETQWDSTDFISNNEIYKNEAYDDFLIVTDGISDISRYYFFSKLKNNLFNKYEFDPEEFEEEHYNNCTSNLNVENLTTLIINGYIYGYYTTEEAEKIFNLFEKGNRTEKFNELLDIVNNKEIRSTNFSDWIREIKDLDENKDINISIKLYNNSDNLNYGTRYIVFPNDLILNISLFVTILQNIQSQDHCRIINFEMFLYKNIFFEILLYAKNGDETKGDLIPNDKFLEEQWKMKLKDYNEFNRNVDNIGNRYYYIKKNFVLILYKQQASLRQRASDILKGILYEGTIIDPQKIMEDYVNKYNGKKFDIYELNGTIQYYSNLNNRKRIDVHTLGK